MVRVKTNFTAEEIMAHSADLSGGQLEVLDGWLAGKNYETMAVELGVAVGTVKSRLNRARRKLMSFEKLS